ncbi:MAG: hypothetical protein C4519_07085 [Desulfobacteraceae bacterium]|nr:MAG: hypothetical protein C4519_07085 [Desulfobacteraceae bacterium]
MRQRYFISKEGIANDLVIREYAATGKDTRKMQGVMPEDDFTLLCQENYKGELIQVSISTGIDGLIATLRTENLFPVGLFAAKIAESVITLYSSSEDGSTELSFDDMELFAHT